MKKLLFTLSLLGAFAAFATDEIDASAQIFGALPITTASNPVIVSVPWIASGYDTTAAIAVSNIIKTAGLTVGDKIQVWNTSKKAYNVWILAEDSTTHVKTWVAGSVVTVSGITPGDGADITTLKRGDALILDRQNPGTSAAPNTFYVYGQYCALTSSDKTTVVKGSQATPAYTLLAPPVVSSSTYDLNSLKWSNLPSTTATRGATNDCIKVGVRRGTKNMYSTYYLKDETGDPKWGYWNLSGNWVNAPEISTGIGVWYVSRGGEPTVTWGE